MDKKLGWESYQAIACMAAGVSLFDGDDMSPATVVLTDLLVFWLWLRFVAWLGRLTDEDGAWSADAFFQDLRDRFGAAFDELRELKDERGLTVALVFAFHSTQLGVVSILLGNWLRIVDVSRTLSTEKSELAELWEPLVSAGISLLLLGMFVGTLVFLRLPEDDDEYADGEITREDVGDLSYYIDLNERRGVRSNDKLLDEVLQVLAKWRPSNDYGNEMRHQQALLRRLRKRLGRKAVEEEVPIEGRRRRLDLLLREQLVLELKVDFRGTSKDERAYSQVVDYARHTDLPVLFVLFKTPEPSENADHWFQRMHAEWPIVTVRMPFSRT